MCIKSKILITIIIPLFLNLLHSQNTYIHKDIDSSNRVTAEYMLFENPKHGIKINLKGRVRFYNQTLEITETSALFYTYNDFNRLLKIEEERNHHKIKEKTEYTYNNKQKTQLRNYINDKLNLSASYTYKNDLLHTEIITDVITGFTKIIQNEYDSLNRLISNTHLSSGDTVHQTFYYYSEEFIIAKTFSKSKKENIFKLAECSVKDTNGKVLSWIYYKSPEANESFRYYYFKSGLLKRIISKDGNRITSIRSFIYKKNILTEEKEKVKQPIRHKRFYTERRRTFYTYTFK